MTIKICDIDYRSEKKMVESRYRAGYRNGLKIDLCEQHKGWTKQFSSEDALFEGLAKLSK